MTNTSPEYSKRKKVIAIVTTITAILLAVLVVGLKMYNSVMSAGVFTEDGKDVDIYIPTNATYQQVKDSLTAHVTIKDMKRFDFVAQKKSYSDKIHPGRYVVKDKMSYNQLINILRGGMQTPVNVTFNNIRNIEALAKRISQQIEADSASIATLLHDSTYLAQLGFDTLTIATMFLPNTYEFYWNTNANDFVERMNREYSTFWTDSRKIKAANTGLDQIKVSILASIIDKETTKTSEMPTIAGVYINRIYRDMPLQADPTLIFILNDPSIHRVLNEHKSLKSPYNTYTHLGLPPGPICIPSIAAIEAVLNYEQHNYFYFCAKEDFSGFHNFAKTLKEHNRNAARYQRELNNKNIFK